MVIKHFFVLETVSLAVEPYNVLNVLVAILQLLV